MPRAKAMVPPEAIRIEDEVWQEAFARREPASPNRRRRLEAIEGGRASRLYDAAVPHDAAVPPAVSAAAPAPSPATSAGAPEVAVPRSRLAVAPMPSTSTAPMPSTSTAPMPSTSTAPLPSTSTASPPSASHASPPARRTVKIQGRGAERNLPAPDPSRRRPTRLPHERAGFRPDRVAMWAVVLGFVLILVAISSGHG